MREPDGNQHTRREPAIDARGLAKRFGDTVAVADVSLRVEQGETFGLVGANGAGKTTTVELLAGLRRADHGSVRVFGLDPVADRKRVRHLLGVQQQEPRLHDSLRVRELVRLFRSFYPNPRAASELLEMVGMHDMAATRFDRLSGGQQQRLSIALALAGRPRALILDELTTGLDPAARRHIWQTVASLQDEGVTILLVSHAMEEIDRLCDRVAVVDEGRIVALSTPKGLVEQAGAQTLDEAFLILTGKELEHPE